MSEPLEIPLKPSQDTFTDDPGELDDVNIHDLVYDIENNVKDINKLHVFQAILIFLYTLQDVMKLQRNPQAFEAFRKVQLAKRNINLDVAEQEISNKTERREDLSSSDNTMDSVSPPNSPPAKMHKTEDSVSSFNALRNTTPDLLVDNESEQSDLEVHVIPIEDLVTTTDLDKSYALDLEDITREFAYHCDPKIIAQNAHVLKCFNLVSIPAMTIEQFLTRIKTYSSSISVLCYIHAAYMLYKLCVLHNVIPLTLYNVHRLILALIRCLSKKLEDVYQKQKAFATVGGVSQKDLFKIEVGFLFLCNFRVVVGLDSLNNYLKEFAELRNFCEERLVDNDDSSN